MASCHPVAVNEVPHPSSFCAVTAGREGYKSYKKRNQVLGLKVVSSSLLTPVLLGAGETETENSLTLSAMAVWMTLTANSFARPSMMEWISLTDFPYR